MDHEFVHPIDIVELSRVALPAHIGLQMMWQVCGADDDVVGLFDLLIAVMELDVILAWSVASLAGNPEVDDLRPEFEGIVHNTAGMG